MDRYHIYGLTEVDPGATRSVCPGTGDRFKSFVTVTGRSDRMMIIFYDVDRLELLANVELEAHDGVRMNDVNFQSPVAVAGSVPRQVDAG